MVSVMLYPCMFCVALSMDLFVLCVVCLTKQFAICLGVFVILLLNVMKLLEVLNWIYHLWSSIDCVCCACGPSERLRCSFHMFCLCFCMSEVISSFSSLRAGSQVFALLMLFLCVILHTIYLGKSLQLLCIFPLGMLCLSAISMMFVKIMLAVCILVGIVV